MRVSGPRARARRMRRMAGSRVLALALMSAAVMLGCTRSGGSVNRNTGADAVEWHYRVRLDRALTRMETELCFVGPTPRELRAGKSEGSERLQYARWLGPGPVRRLRVERGRIQLDSAEQSGCVGYAVKLDEGGSLDAAVRRVGRDLLASPNVWLWRPERRAEAAHATLALELPEGVSALLPWPEQAGVHVLDAAAFRFDSYAAFGRFVRSSTQHRGVQVELALLDGELEIDAAAAQRWLSAGVDMLAALEGGFPAQRLAAIIVPAGDHADPVPFGMVARGGGGSLLLLVSASANERALLTDWVLPHELSHLLLPFIEREQAWLSEGLASYYQELLRARAGLQSERAALARLARYMREAARSEASASVVEESARMQLTHAYRKVYWGGAAFWLHADVRLRHASQGHASLDSLLAALRARGALQRVWTARALLSELDSLAGSTLFTDARNEAAAVSFPPFERTFELLGVRGQPIELDDAAPAAEVRRSLFKQRD